MAALAARLRQLAVDVEAAGAAEADGDVVARLADALSGGIAAVCAEARPAQRRGWAPGFGGLRAALGDLRADLPGEFREICCGGLAFAAGVLADALTTPGGIVCLARDGGLDLSSDQLPEPCGAGEVAESVRLVTRLQCVEVVAAGFFGALDRRDWGKRKLDAQSSDMPVFSFIGLWDFDCDRWSSKNFVLMGVMIFFHTASSYGKAGLAAEHVTITRKAMGAIPEPDEVMFCPIDLQQDGVLIHSFVGEQHLQADFANEYLGGAVMRGGGSQEEELFLCCPELLATLFLVERMLDFEAVEIAGLRRYVDHNMCSGKTWSRSDQFCRPVPEAERLVNLTTVAMDAICFNAYGKLSKSEQYQPANVRREVRKCLVALRPPAAAGPGARRSFVTGLWGCGAFRGDPELKCVIQWICCSLDASVDKMIFCPFDQRECLSHAGLAELVDLLPGRVSAKRVLDLLVEDQDYAWSSSTFRYLLKKLASVGDSPQPPSS